MRFFQLLLVVCAVGGSGCSALVALSGQDLSTLSTKAAVRAKCGTPESDGQAAGQSFEEFSARRKIAQPWKGTYLTMGFSGTLGLGELVWFPHQSYIAIRRAIVGQQLRFTYDSNG